MFLVEPGQKSQILTFSESPDTMYYLKDRTDALTTFMPALIDECEYMVELIWEYIKMPEKQLPEFCRRISQLSIGSGDKQKEGQLTPISSHFS